MKRWASRLPALFFLAAFLRAEPADWIWTARYVITQDMQRRVIEDGAVAILSASPLVWGDNP